MSSMRTNVICWQRRCDGHVSCLWHGCTFFINMDINFSIDCYENPTDLKVSRIINSFWQGSCICTWVRVWHLQNKCHLFERECRFRNINPGNFCFWNPESWTLESGIQFKESGIPLTIGIRNPNSTDKPSGIQYLESRIQDCLGIPNTRSDKWDKLSTSVK